MRLPRAALATSLYALALIACDSGPKIGSTSFVSAPPPSGGGRFAGGERANDAHATPPAASPSTTTQQPRTVEETDLYRLEGDRLYFLNAYRGLMVFDVSDVEHPRLVGRSPIFGSPVEMIVRDGVATIVVANWYGTMDDGTPFNGSIVRGLDARDPANIRVLGEARLGGWVRDTRIVGDVLYAVSEDWGSVYGWGRGLETVATVQPRGPSVIVSSVSFAGGNIRAVSREDFSGYGGIFHVTADSILLAHDAVPASHDPNVAPHPDAGKTELLYLDISDAAGAIVRRGSIKVNGRAQGWGADNGRWNVDFADGRTAHMIGCAGGYYWGCGGDSGYILATADFTNPDAPVLLSELSIPTTGWGIAARFSADRLYLSPDSYSWGQNGTTPFQVYDLSNSSAPFLAGTVEIPGTVWNVLPAPGNRIFALGNDWSNPNAGSQVSLKYIDASDPAAPQLLATTSFGEGWAWTPAAGTFKAFTMDAQRGLVVLPFSGWSHMSNRYNNGLQLIEFTLDTARTAGAANTRGWVERGIFVGDRLVSLSDLALSVVDYADHDAPVVIAELTLARNVIAARPNGATIATVSSDWWDNDASTSEVRVLPIGEAEETTDDASAQTLTIDGVNAQVFQNGDFFYIVTQRRVDVACPQGSDPSAVCQGSVEQVQVVDLSNGGATLRGTVSLPTHGYGYGWWGWGWVGCFWYDWYSGANVVQVGGDALAFRRWEPQYDAATGQYIDSDSRLYVVDLSSPDAPTLASTTVLTDPNGWWGNMIVVGDTLYTSHYDWVVNSQDPNVPSSARYYVDRVDLTDRAHPSIGLSINVPGILVGGSATDPSILYTIDYQWFSNNQQQNTFNVLQVSGNIATLIGVQNIEGYVGSVFIRGEHAYFSAQRYTDPVNWTGPVLELHALDLGDPTALVDHVSVAGAGWGWLLAVEGDRALVTSGWGGGGLDVYTLSDGQAPVFDQFVRTRGWWGGGNISRQGDDLFISTGYWGVQKISL